MNIPDLSAQTRRFVALNWPGCQSEKAESVQNLCLINVNPFRYQCSAHAHIQKERERDREGESTHRLSNGMRSISEVLLVKRVPVR